MTRSPKASFGAGFRAGLLAPLLLLAACGADPGSGPLEARWDRATCERCRMVLSDRNHSAQVRITRPDARSKVRFFDDIGCAVIWLDAQTAEIPDAPATEIWVNDWRSGAWIDARDATYVPGQTTPMGYGLGAQTESVPGGLDYGQAKEHIWEVERRFNIHGGNSHPDALADPPRSSL